MLENIFMGFIKVGLIHYLILAAALFAVGLVGIIVSRNVIKVLMSVEILLNAVNINFAAFSYYTDLGALQGQVFALFIMAIAAAEVAIALAILIALYRNKQTVDVEKYSKLKG